jgi:hypothetical protein
MKACGVCGDTTGRCRFARACSCWRGVPCLTQMAAAGERWDKDGATNVAPSTAPTHAIDARESADWDAWRDANIPGGE